MEKMHLDLVLDLVLHLTQVIDLELLDLDLVSIVFLRVVLLMNNCSALVCVVVGELMQFVVSRYDPEIDGK